MLRVDLNEMLETRSKTSTAGKSNRYSIKGHNIEFQILQIRPYKVKIFTKYYFFPTIQQLKVLKVSSSIMVRLYRIQAMVIWNPYVI